MTFLLKEAGFVLVGRGSFLPRVQPARKEKWEQKRNIWTTRKVLCSKSRSDSGQLGNERSAASTCPSPNKNGAKSPA